MPRGSVAGGRGVGRGGGRRARRREWRAGAGMGWRRARPRARRVLWRLLAAAMAGSMISSAVCQRVTSARCDQRRFDSNSRQRPRNVRRRFEPRFRGTRARSPPARPSARASRPVAAARCNLHLVASASTSSASAPPRLVALQTTPTASCRTDRGLRRLAWPQSHIETHGSSIKPKI